MVIANVSRTTNGTGLTSNDISVEIMGMRSIKTSSLLNVVVKIAASMLILRSVLTISRAPLQSWRGSTMGRRNTGNQFSESKYGPAC